MWVQYSASPYAISGETNTVPAHKIAQIFETAPPRARDDGQGTNTHPKPLKTQRIHAQSFTTGLCRRVNEPVLARKVIRICRVLDGTLQTPNPDRHFRICQASAREQCPASPRNRGARPTLKTAMLTPADRRRAFQLFEDNFLTAVMIQGCDDCNIRGGRQRDILRNPATLLSKRDRASADTTIDQLDS